MVLPAGGRATGQEELTLLGQERSPRTAPRDRVISVETREMRS